jgi:serine/threonine protein kinase
MGAAAGQGQDAVEGLGDASAASFGKYNLFASLGRGGMADVFLSVARGPMGFNKLAVIKRLRAALADDPQFREMFLDEARLAARLNHPNVVHTYEVGDQDGVYFIAMEYLEGQPLNKVIREAVKRNEIFDQCFCARVISDALAGLNHAHELADYDGRPLNIIHRDISPHNIFVTYGGQVKVVDFGIAKAALSSTETEVGVLKGKVAYMSPEQAMAGPIDQRADIFAMGIVLWELLTRQRLMTGDSAASTLNRLLNAPIPSVSTLREDVDPELDAIVGRALEKDPQYRFQTAQEMRDALDTFIRATGDKFRQDEVGRRMTTMFAKVREEVQRQIQAHMATLSTAANTVELAALSVDGMKQRSMATNGASLLQLNVGGGSGSGVVPAFNAGNSQSSVMASSLSAAGRSVVGGVPVPEKNNNRMLVVLITVMMGLLACAVVALLLMGLKKKPGEGVGAAGSGSAASVESAASVPSGAPSAIAPVAVVPDPNVARPVAAKPPVGGAAGGGRHPAAPIKPAAPPVAPAGDDGHLTLDTYPFTRVSENGKVLGTTPIINVALPPGTHNLMLENADQGIKQSFTVTIKSGETVTKKLGLK